MILDIGEIIKAQGIRGEVKVKVLIRDSGLLKNLNTLIVESIPFKVESLSIRNGFAYYLFQGVTDRNRAEMLVGKKIRIDSDCLPPLKEGEYYIADLVGKEVRLYGGDSLGVITLVENYGSADIITVKGEKTVRFPFLKKLKLKLDDAAGTVTIDGQAFEEVAVYED